ncbi:ABC transporter permease [Atopobiaceae bacterium 24-176]
MARYLIRRVLATVPVLFVVSVAAFLVVRLVPGGPATALLGMEASPEQVATLNASLGFDRPLPVQYVEWLGGVLTGDWGRSYFLQMPVTEALAQYMGPTLSLAMLAQGIATLVAVPLGVAAARRRGSAVDGACVAASVAGSVVPSFLVAMVLMAVFSLGLGWFPVTGYAGLEEGLLEHLRYLMLPACSLAFAQAALIARMTRSAMLDALAGDYMRTARAKGLKERAMLFGHALKNAGPAVLTVLGQSLASLATGAIVCETVFGIPGLGMLMMGAVERRDVFLLQGAILLVALIYVMVNLAVDLLYGVVDPRMRLAGGEGR